MSEKLVEVILDKEHGYGVMLPESEARALLKSMPKVEDKQVAPVENKMIEPAEKKAAQDTEEKPVSKRKSK